MLGKDRNPLACLHSLICWLSLRFYFTFALSLVGLVLLFMVNVDKAKQDNAKFLEREREDLYKSYGQRGDLAVEIEQKLPSVHVQAD